jgi:hypothetical protein
MGIIPRDSRLAQRAMPRSPDRAGKGISRPKIQALFRPAATFE